MIDVDDAPRWIRELARFLTLKNAVFLYGNVLDRVSYPVRPDQGEKYWVSSSLGEFLIRYLGERGYDIIGTCDSVDGLRFADGAMRERFGRLQPGLATTGRTTVDQGSGRRADGGPGSDACRQPPASAEQSRPALAQGGADLASSLPGIRRALANQTTPSAIIVEHASRLTGSPDRLYGDELRLFSQLQRAILEAETVICGESEKKNLLIFVCDKLNDLPPFLYVNNPRARAIAIEKPDGVTRARLLRSYYPTFYGVSGGAPDDDLEGAFTALTEGMTNYEILSLAALSQEEAIPVTDTKRLLDRYKYGVKESEWDKIGRQRLLAAEQTIARRVLGQPAAVARVLDIIKRARSGIAAGSPSQRPRGVLFFAGPTGVGKTELAKALAESLFGEEQRLIRFDMSEYGAPHSDERLLGAPPGYVGYQEGGQLTNALKANPFSVLLFDEIEKAHPKVFEKFLQILDDGRLTDGRGDTVYFSESIIIFTSNLGTIDRSDQGGAAQRMLNPDMPYSKVKEVIERAVRDYVTFELRRPEILNRFGDNIVVFGYIPPKLIKDIARLLATKLAAAYREQRRIELTVSEQVIEALATLGGTQREYGGRGVRNMVDAALVNPLARWLFDNDVGECCRVEVARLLDHGADADYRFELEATFREL